MTSTVTADPRIRVAVGILAAGIIGFIVVFALSHHGPRNGNSARRQVWFRGEPIAAVDEVVTSSTVRDAAEHVRRTIRLEALGGADVVVDADLDVDGFVVAARYERPGQRIVELQGNVLVVDGRWRTTLPAPVVLLELLPQLRTTVTVEATLLDLSSAEWTSSSLQRRGPEVVAVVDERVVVRARPEGRRTGPGAFVEDDAAPGLPSAGAAIAVPGLRSLRGRQLGGVARQLPPLPTTSSHADLVPGPFIESDSDEVRGFALPLCASTDTESARHIAEAVRPRVDARAIAVVPGARRMLAAGGDCDGAAALVVASLRACGHPARVVVGYRLVDAGTDSARLVPHAVAELYRVGAGDDDGAWWRIDATVPALGDLDDDFVPVAAGLGGALTMGRVLGVLDGGDVIERDAPAIEEGNDARP